MTVMETLRAPSVQIKHIPLISLSLLSNILTIHTCFISILQNSFIIHQSGGNFTDTKGKLK